jgi:flagellar operon protein (TIGR03826 family)
MSLGKLSNCSRCGALFVQVVRDICPTCYQMIEKEYEACATYLRKRENRGATIYQLSEATGVSVKQITRFIREGRISIANNPNMGYPCERCGSLIRSGQYCDDCISHLQRDIVQELDVERRLEEEKRTRMAEATYRRKKNRDE